MTRHLFSVSLAILIMIVAVPVYAQLSLEGYTEKLSLAVTPPNPEPGTVVHARVTSSILDLEQSTVEWYVDGKLIDSTSSPFEIDAKTRALGTKMSIVVHVTAQNGTLYGIERILTPAEVDLLWSIDSYAPPFFRGRHLSTAESLIHAEAIARVSNAGTLRPSKDIVYTWRHNGALVSDASGRGKSKAAFPVSAPHDTDSISVEISTLDDVIAGATVKIPSINPILTLYQDDPLFGVLYNAALSGITSFADADTVFVAIPYFTPVQNPSDSGFRYKWTVGGTPIVSDIQEPYKLKLTAHDPGERARVALSLTHSADIFLNAQSTWDFILNMAAGSSAITPFGNSTN